MVRLVFCDLDGTLVHYLNHSNGMQLVTSDPINNRALIKDQAKTGRVVECIGLASMTQGTGYISLGTFDKIKQLQALGVQVVVITGARTSTFLARRPLLPTFDFEVYENGGKITSASSGGSARERLDENWLERMKPCFEGVLEYEKMKDLPAEKRSGSLWDCFRELKAEGWKVDARNYWTAFRVTVPKEKSAVFEEMMKSLEPRGLKCAFNLGKADIFPGSSGKSNAAKYIMELVGATPDECIAL
jgi:hydroxymethylpyrimidine pyrophosphatase-like HAD family hydrolase